ncbi:unnamed protein product [Cuscuta epithymum]|uniref:Uncharacterized protein n=1 Tax=Cuscuta epithymum TaxID=186058 RepID=A0AAV0GGR9_9ASTE|nr:unnamed protein product [Cuscuta epithymum]
MFAALCVRFFSSAAYETQTESAILALTTEITKLTTDVCMAAIYAKLHNIHKSFGRYESRYASDDDVPLPLPFAVAVQDFGVFETHSMVTNLILAATYPEGLQHEGISQPTYCSAEYLSFIPTLKELGFPLKPIDPHVTAGSPRWTYKVKNIYGTCDLACILPPSHYSELSAILRTVLLVPDFLITMVFAARSSRFRMIVRTTELE